MQNESVSYLESFAQQLIAVCRPAGSTAGAKRAAGLDPPLQL